MTDDVAGEVRSYHGPLKVGDWVRFRSWVDGHKRWGRVVRMAPVVVAWGDVGDGPCTSSVHVGGGELLEVDNEPVRVDAGPRTMG